MFPSATELNYQQVFKSAPSALVVIAADDKFTITAVSDAYLRVTMRDEADILGKGMFEAFPGNPDTPDATGVDQLRASFMDVLAKGTVQTMPVVKYDIRRPDGHFEERFWSATHTPLSDSNGEISHILQHTEDITEIVRLQQRDLESSAEKKRLQLRTNQVEAEVVRRVEELEDAYRRLEDSEVALRRLAEDAIIKENRYSAAVLATGQLLYDWDPKTNDLWYEGDVEQLLGYTMDEMAGGLSRWIEVIHPDDRLNFSREIERVLTSGDAADVEFRMIRKDGRIIYCEDRGRFFRDASGNVMRMVGFVRDITARKQTEQALEAYQERLRIAQRAGHVGVFDWEVTENRIVWTPELEMLYGLPPGTFEGQLSDWAKRVVPEDADRVLQEIQRCSELGEKELRYEFRAVMSDGRLLWLEGIAHFMYDGDGKPARMIGVNVDVHERKTVEEALRLSEQRMQLAIAIAEIGTFDICLKTDKVIVNDIGRMIYGWTPDEEVLFTEVQKQFHPDDRQRVMDEVHKALEEDSSGEFEVEQRIIRRDGETRWIRVRGRCLSDSKKSASNRVVGTYLDITAEKQREEHQEELNVQLAHARDEAIAASAAKSTFLATMSHELRTPLNAVIGYAELLRDAAEHGTLSTPALIADLERISLSGEHLLTLISDILDFSKIEAGRMELNNEMVDLQQLLDDAAVAITPQNNAKGNHLTVCLPPAGTLIVGDYTRLKQILINLLGNSAKFTTAGKINLEAELVEPQSGTEIHGIKGNDGATERMFVLRVQDTGIGIAEENLPLLFESFRQIDASRTRQHGGTGLGLAITKRLVELMGGRIEVKSEVGKGTTFTIFIPQPF